MNHQELADGFYRVAQVLNSSAMKPDEEDYKKRVVFARLYYAAYHKCLHHDVNLQKSTESNKHYTLKQKMVNQDDTLRRVYLSLYHLRFWADYQIQDSNSPEFTKLTSYIYETGKILKRATIPL